MTRVFVISDTHFGHTKTWAEFKREDGTPMRPFTSTEEMDETMVNNWNNTVRPEDHIYHLGDVVIGRKHLQIIRRLNGHKRLVLGNHDIFTVEEYLDVGFEKVYGVRVWPKHGYIMSHIPLHPDQLKSRNWINLHGHLHVNHVKGPDAERYKNVSVEQINYTPLLLME